MFILLLQAVDNEKYCFVFFTVEMQELLPFKYVQIGEAIVQSIQC